MFEIISNVKNKITINIELLAINSNGKILKKRKNSYIV